MFVFCVYLQAFQQTLSRATEIASRNSLKSMKFTWGRTHRQKHSRSQFHCRGPISRSHRVEWIFNVKLFYPSHSDFLSLPSSICPFPSISLFQVKESLLSLQQLAVFQEADSDPTVAWGEDGPHWVLHFPHFIHTYVQVDLWCCSWFLFNNWLISPLVSLTTTNHCNCNWLYPITCYHMSFVLHHFEV